MVILSVLYKNSLLSRKFLKYVALLIFFIVHVYPMEEKLGILMPLEIHGHITKKFFDVVIRDKDNNIEENINFDRLQEYVLRVPFSLGVKFAREFCNLEKLCPLEIAGKKFTALELFCLPQRERDVVLRIKNRSIFLDGNIGEQDFTILDASQHKKQLKGLKLEVNFVNSNVEYLERIAIITAMIGAVISRLRSSPNYTALIFFGYSAFLKGCVEVLNIFNPNFSMHTKWRRKKIEFKE